jgi:hypothetical protein
MPALRRVKVAPCTRRSVRIRWNSRRGMALLPSVALRSNPTGTSRPRAFVQHRQRTACEADIVLDCALLLPVRYIGTVRTSVPVEYLSGAPPEDCDMLKGSCLCGRMSFEIHGAVHSARYCHCATCRKFSGTAYAAWGVVQANHLIVTGSELGVTKFDSGGGLRAFCSSCGSPLWYEPANVPTFRGIPLGVIDEGDVPTPQMHVWTQSKVSWASFEDELPRHETHP